MTQRRTLSCLVTLWTILLTLLPALLPVHARAEDVPAAPAATAPAAAPSTTPSATATPAAADADKDDDDDDDDDAKAPVKKKGLFGPKKLPFCKPGQEPGPKDKPVCRIKLPKMTPVNITDGTLTVDGMIAKVGLNYQIADLKFLYFWVPGTGIIVVADKPFPNAKEEPAAFHGKGLTVSVNDHNVQLYSDQPLLKKNGKELSAWVLLDPTNTAPSDDPHFRSPTFGWGVSSVSPYTWPGSKMSDPKKHALAPPVPKNLRPVYVQPVALSLGVPAKPTTTPAPVAPAATPATTAAPAAAPAAAASNAASNAPGQQ